MTPPRLTTAETARQLGVSQHRVRKLVALYAWLAQPKGTPPTYHPQFVTRYRAMRSQPHLTLEPAHRDWLARYQGELVSQPAQPARRRRASVAAEGVPGGLDPTVEVSPVAEGLDDDGTQEMQLLVYPGELFTQASTLAVVLPGDSKESYFSARHVAIVQPDEDAEEVILRGIDVVNTAVEANIRDTVERYAPPAPPAEQ